ncbi:MAG: serine/threonine protein kinase [Proteobacteria bacterium]|jgi:hypothetical protein|nr:serine/threonine protein kinase [Pseudomonadota bacterium]
MVLLLVQQVMHLLPGTVLGKLVVEAPIGQGPMATVYRLRHQVTSELFALKVPTHGSEAIREQWLQAARLQKDLIHLNIVNIVQVLTWPEGEGLLMEFVRGPTLGQLLASRRLTRDQVDLIAKGLFAGVAAAHQSGFVHGDIKPGNILLAVEGGHLVPKITDFGIVSAHSTEAATEVARGTFAYLAPEQLTHQPSDKKADVYSLGAVLYELVTGSRPFVSSTPEALCQAIKEQQYVAPSILVPSLPERMERSIVDALQVAPERRPTSVEEMARAWSAEETQDESGIWGPNFLDSLQTLAPRKTGAPAPQRPAPAAAISLESAIRIPLLVGLLALAIAVVLNTFWPPRMGTPYGQANRHYEDGLRHLITTDFVEAETQMLKAISVDSHSLSPHLGLFVSRALQRRNIHAGEALQRASLTSQTSRGPVADLIQTLESVWEGDSLVSQEQIQQNNSFYLGHLALVVAAAHSENPRASAHLEGLIQGAPQAAVGYSLAVQFFQSQRRWEQAEVKLTEMERLFPEAGQTRELRAIQAFNGGDLHGALEALASDELPPSARIVLSRVEIEYFFNQGQLHLAEERHQDCGEQSQKQGSDYDLSACNSVWFAMTEKMGGSELELPPVSGEHDLFLRVRDRVIQAEKAFEQGDLPLAANQLDEVDQLWPAADDDHPLILRTVAVRQQIVELEQE